MKSRWRNVLVAGALCGGLMGACDASNDSDASNTEITPWTCSEPWMAVTATRGERCEPPEMPTCEEGALALPDGSCAPAWVCPEGWTRAENGRACAPPPVDDGCPEGTFALAMGGCSEPWLCPEGWERHARGMGCRVRYDTCPEGERPVEGGGCAAFPMGCSGSRWGDSPWPEGTLYVDANTASSAPDGSRDAPFPTLRAALEARTALQSTIALAEGTYDEGDLSLSGSLEIGGACAEGVAIQAQLEMISSATALHLHDVSIVGRSHGVRSQYGSLRLERTWFREGLRAAIRAEGVDVEATDLRVTGPLNGTAIEITSSIGKPGTLKCERCLITGAGRGVESTDPENEVHLTETAILDNDGEGIISAGKLTLEEVLVRGNRLVSIRLDAGAGSGLIGERVVIQDTQAGSQIESKGGAGIWMQGARLELRDAVVSGHSITAIRGQRGGLAGAPVNVLLRRVLIEDTSPGSGLGGKAIELIGSDLDAEHVHIREAASVGIELKPGEGNKPSTARLHAVWIEAIQASQRESVGLSVTGTDTTCDLEGVLIQNTQGMGVLVEGGSVTARDLRIEDVGGAPVEVGGITVRQGGTLEAVDVRVQNTQTLGVFAEDPETSVTLERFEVASSYRLDSNPAAGIFATSASQVRLTDGVIRGHPTFGLTTLSKAQARASRVWITSNYDALSSQPGTFSSGLFVSEGLLISDDLEVEDHFDFGVVLVGMDRVEMLRTRVQDTGGESQSDVRYAGVYVSGAGGAHVLSGLWIRRVIDMGLGVYEGAQVHVDNAHIHEVDGVGLLGHSDADLQLSDVRIEDIAGTGLYGTSASVWDIERLVIQDTRASAEGEAEGATLDASSFVAARDWIVRRNAGSGVGISGAFVSVVGGMISGNARGLVLQLEAQWQPESVFIEDNEVNDERCSSICLETPTAVEGIDRLAPIE